MPIAATFAASRIIDARAVAGPIEAATSVGMRSFDILWRISLPTMLVATLPSIVNLLIVLSKETVVLSIITVPELMYQMQTMAAEIDRPIRPTRAGRPLVSCVHVVPPSPLL